MYRVLACLIILHFVIRPSYCQDFEFIWQVWPSFYNSYTVKISERNSRKIIVIKKTSSNDSILKKIKNKDCDTLLSFLNTYEFPTKGNKVYGLKVREYAETKALPDTDWVVLNGDTVRRELLWIQGLLFDNDSNKFYQEFQSVGIWGDGNTYKVEYIRNDVRMEFSIHSSRISASDYALNKLIYNFISKYGSNKNYVHLEKIIESDKPANQ